MNYDNGLKDLSKLEIELDTAPKYQLPEPEKFMSAKAYKAKMAEPVELLRKVFGRKQIDDWVEQERMVKSRKRDNTRSR